MSLKAVEPRRSAEEAHNLAAALKRLAVAARLEREARRESDALMAFAWDLGATDHTLAQTMGVTVDTARMRRRRRGLRRNPLHRQRGNKAA